METNCVEIRNDAHRDPVGDHERPSPGLCPNRTLSEHSLEGLKYHLNVPEGLTEDKPGSLVILMHGVGGRAKNFMSVLDPWVKEGYLICAPQSAGIIWNPHEFKAAESVALHLLKEMPLNPKKVHVMGFGPGAIGLAPLSLSDKLKPVSAIYAGGSVGMVKVPKWARKTQGVLLVAGEKDRAADLARVGQLALLTRVRSLEYRFVPNLGHSWPISLTPYLLWWTGIQEGRFQFGESC